MLTFKFWSVLQVATTNPKVAALHLRPKTKTTPNTFFRKPTGIVVALGVVVAIFMLPALCLPAALLYYFLRPAFRIAEGVAHMNNFHGRDLLAITPIGELTMVLDICRMALERQVNQANLESDKRNARIVLGFASFSLILVVASIALKSDPFYWGIATGFVAMSAIAMIFFVDYRQAVVLATLTSIHAGLSSKSINAPLTTFFMFALLQFSLYAMLAFTPSLASFIRASTNPLRYDMSLLAAFTLIAAPVYVLREGIITLLWYWLRQRINDDVTAPTL